MNLQTPQRKLSIASPFRKVCTLASSSCHVVSEYQCYDGGWPADHSCFQFGPIDGCDDCAGDGRAASFSPPSALRARLAACPTGVSLRAAETLSKADR